MTKKLTAVYRALDENTANIIRNVLDDEGLIAVVKAYHSALFDGIFVSDDGAWGEVLVPEDQADLAREILEERESDNSLTEE